MNIIYKLTFVCVLNIYACDNQHNLAQIDQSTCAESQSLRIHFREKIDSLRDRNLIHNDMHKAIAETIRTRPIHELDHLFTFINTTHNTH